MILILFLPPLQQLLLASLLCGWMVPSQGNSGRKTDWPPGPPGACTPAGEAGSALCTEVLLCLVVMWALEKSSAHRGEGKCKGLQFTSWPEAVTPSQGTWVWEKSIPGGGTSSARPMLEVHRVPLKGRQQELRAGLSRSPACP